MKKTSMLKTVESLEYIKCYSSSSPDLLKALAILSDTTVGRSAVDWEDLKPHWKYGFKKGHISLSDPQSYHLQVLSRL